MKVSISAGSAVETKILTRLPYQLVIKVIVKNGGRSTNKERDRDNLDFHVADETSILLLVAGCGLRVAASLFDFWTFSHRL